MKVRMKTTLSGLRDGVPWPPRGEVLIVPDDEGASLCASGVAVPVTTVKDSGAETAIVPDDSEKRQEQPPATVTSETAPALAKKTIPRKAPAKKAAPVKATPKPDADGQTGA